MVAAALVAGIVCLTADPAPATATLRLMDGRTVTGVVANVAAERITGTWDGGSQSLPVREVAGIHWGSAPPAASAIGAVVVELTDGSVLAGKEIEIKGTKGVLTIGEGLSWELPRRSVRTVRFVVANASTPADAWKTALEGNLASDILVVRKVVAGADGGTAVRLDPLEGTVLEVAKDSVRFDFDGEKIDVKREKLAGFALFQPPLPAAASAPVCRVLWNGQAIVLATSLQWTGDRVTATTRPGASLAFPIGEGLALDFRGVNEQPLAELVPVASESSFALQPKGMTHDFSRLLGVRGNGFFGGGTLKLGKRQFASGLALHSRTVVSYRVPEGFRTFLATAGVPDSASPAADVQLKVLGNNKPLFEQTFNAERGRGPAEVQCDLTGLDRLTIHVEPSGGLDVGDLLILGEARFVK